LTTLATPRPYPAIVPSCTSIETSLVESDATTTWTQSTYVWLAARTRELTAESDLSWEDGWRQAADELRVVTRTSTPDGCLIALWLAGIVSANFLWFAMTYTGSDSSIIMVFFMGLPGIPLLIGAVILTVQAYFARRIPHP
jgi:hypothetical protein